MVRVALLFVLIAKALSQCPPPTTQPPNNDCGGTTQSPYNNCSTSNGGDDNICKEVKTITRPLSVIFTEQPVYYFFLSKADRFTRLDNVCLTFFPLPDSPETFRAVRSFVYTDGSTAYVSYVTKSGSTGANIWSNAQRVFVNYNLGSVGCGAFLRYSCPVFGDGVKPFFLGFGPGLGNVGNGTGRINDSCIQEARRLINENDLDLDDFYVLPYNLPTNCLFQQPCLPEDSPLYCQQNKSCKAYEGF